MPYATDFTEAKVNHFFNVEIGILEPTLAKTREEGIEIQDTNNVGTMSTTQGKCHVAIHVAMLS